MDLPPGMGYASPEFQQTFRYKLGILFGKVNIYITYHYRKVGKSVLFYGTIKVTF